MKTKPKTRIPSLASRIINKNKGVPKYSIDLLVRQLTGDSRGIQLGSYLNYATRIERKL